MPIPGEMMKKLWCIHDVQFYARVLKLRQIYGHCRKTSLKYTVKRNDQVTEPIFVKRKPQCYIFLSPFKCIEECLAHSKQWLNTLGISCRTLPVQQCLLVFNTHIS